MKITSSHSTRAVSNQWHLDRDGRERWVRLSGTYSFELKKECNFDADKAPIKVWGIPYDVGGLSRMPAHGLSRDFTVQGSMLGYADFTGHP